MRSSPTTHASWPGSMTYASPQRNPRPLSRLLKGARSYASELRRLIVAALKRGPGCTSLQASVVLLP
jgi:hypothetical protein